MQTRLSTKGQIVLPGPVRTRLGLRAGDTLDIHVEENRVVLTPQKKVTPKARIVKDPVSGAPVLFAEDAPILTSEEVAEILSSFP